jgi:hypothetical protein
MATPGRPFSSEGEIGCQDGFSCALRTSFHSALQKKPGRLSSLKGNPAVRLGPVAFRPHLAMGLAKINQGCKKAKARYEDSPVAGFPVPPKRAAK